MCVLPKTGAILDCVEHLIESKFRPHCIQYTVPSLSNSKYGSWYFLIIFIMNWRMTFSPLQVLTEISVSGGGHHTGPRVELLPNHSRINITFIFHFHNNIFIFPAQWIQMTGDYSSCQPAASTIIDSANPSCSVIWGKYSFPEIIDFYSVITLLTRV